MSYDDECYYYVKNLQGDVTAIYSECGCLAAEYTYDAWGNCTITYDPYGIGELNPIRYRSYYYDTETGLYYLKSRYYDPNTGRFINPDLISYLGANGSIISYNQFAYCDNNPVILVDHNGKFAITALIVGALIGAAIGFGSTVAADYADDGKVFNGSISAGGYVANTVVGSVVGGLSGGVGSSTLTLTYPTLSLAATSVGTTVAVIGTATTTVQGTAVLAGATTVGLSILLFSKPNSGRIRFSDGTGINPDTGKEFKNADDARKYYKSIKDPKMKNNWKRWLKGKGWYNNHLK